MDIDDNTIVTDNEGLIANVTSQDEEVDCENNYAYKEKISISASITLSISLSIFMYLSVYLYIFDSI